MRRIDSSIFSLVLMLVLPATLAAGQANLAAPAGANPMRQLVRPWDLGVLVQGGLGVTENRSNIRFLMGGVHAGKVLTNNIGPGLLHGNFEYAIEVFPFWQSYTPTTLRQNCVYVNTGGVQQASCSAPFKIGGTFTGLSITPILLRWNFVGTKRWAPWMQGGGGVIWTNHKYPAFGGPPVTTGGISDSSIGDNGPNDDASVWNFTPQFGVGAHYFLNPKHSIDFGANAIHVSSASLGDRNPGVNASVQFTIGYSWWK